MPIDYSRNDRDLEPKYKYSPFRNIGPQKPYELKDANGKRREDCRKQYEGQIYHTKQGYDIEIVDYMSVHNVIVRFVHDGYMKFTGMNNIKKGLVAYPFHPNIYGGYPGVGYYNQSNNKAIHTTWFGILTRTHLDQNSDFSDRHKSYKKSTICPEWLNFQNFAFWFDCYISLLNPDISLNYQVDKDILQWGFINKIYSPSTCCIIPKEINSLLEGLQHEIEKSNQNLPKGVYEYKQAKSIKYVANCSYSGNSKYLGTFDTPEEAFLVYKEAKEKYIKEVADYYLSINAILPNIHDALYKIDIKPFGE